MFLIVVIFPYMWWIIFLSNILIILFWSTFLNPISWNDTFIYYLLPPPGWTTSFHLFANLIYFSWKLVILIKIAATLIYNFSFHWDSIRKIWDILFTRKLIHLRIYCYIQLFFITLSKAHREVNLQSII